MPCGIETRYVQRLHFRSVAVGNRRQLFLRKHALHDQEPALWRAQVATRGQHIRNGRERASNQRIEFCLRMEFLHAFLYDSDVFQAQLIHGLRGKTRLLGIAVEQGEFEIRARQCRKSC